MEAIEWPNIGNQAVPLFFKYLPDRLVTHLWVFVRIGIGDAAIFEPSVQLRVGFELRPRHEEPPSDHAHLVLNLSLLPPGSRRANDRFNDIMPAHLLETTVAGAILADEDRVCHRLHIVVDAACARTAKEGERLVMGIKNHLLRLALISPHKRHPTVTEAHMRDLHRRRDAID